jgi:C4-dicarboxylate-specific signal transduction histidine kinase
MLHIRTRRDANGAVIEVTDNGPGIRPEHLARIFEPFFTTKPVGQGTGLGLSISQGLIADQGGRLEVASPAQPNGKGARFTIHLAPSSVPSTPGRQAVSV